jgi:ABC-2 type transport system ATP-binding protein
MGAADEPHRNGPTLSIRSLTRRFSEVTALQDVSFDVRPGRLTGFVGANGAGKTTTMRIVMGVLAETSGEVWWADEPVTAEARRTFGYMPEERGLYPKMRVHDQLVFFARLHGMTTDEASRRADGLIERLGIADRGHDVLQTLSLGNQQRVQIAAALVHQPRLLILDEPFSGLDPIAADTMAEILRDEAARGVPVLFSSHQLDLIEKLCDDLVILSHGHVVAHGPADSLRETANPRYEVTLANDADAAWLREVAGVVMVELDGSTALVDLDGREPAELLSDIVSKTQVAEFSRVVPKLSEIFREVTR